MAKGGRNYGWGGDFGREQFNARMRETARRVLGKRSSAAAIPRASAEAAAKASLRIKALPTPSYTERARTQAIAVAGADSGSGP